MSQIKFNQVSKEYSNKVKALDNVSFEIAPGEFIFLIGPSGAGKSTLIKMLIREEIPSEGEVILNNQNLLDVPYSDIPDLRRRVGVVFQDFKVLPSKSVFENVAIALDVVDTPQVEIQEIVPNVLNLVGLFEKMDSFPSQLSGGELQRLSIARAFAHEPDILVADEPTGMIDPIATEEVLDILEKINALGTTIVMSTHDQHIVDRMKKRVIKLERGQLVWDKVGGKYRG